MRFDFFEFYGFAEAGFIGISGLRGFGFPGVVAVRDFFNFLSRQFLVDAVNQDAHFVGINEEGFAAAVAAFGILFVAGEKPEADGDLGGEEQLAGDPSAQFKDVPLLIMVGVNDTLIATPRRIDEQLKSENIAHDYKEMPGLDHGGIIMGGMPDVFKFFGQHTKP